MTSKNGFSRCGELYIGRLREEGRHSTAHVYKNALFSFSKFCGMSNVSFRQVTRAQDFPLSRLFFSQNHCLLLDSLTSAFLSSVHK